MFSEAIAIANLPSEHPELTHKDNFKLKFYNLKTKYYAQACSQEGSVGSDKLPLQRKGLLLK